MSPADDTGVPLNHLIERAVATHIGNLALVPGDELRAELRDNEAMRTALFGPILTTTERTIRGDGLNRDREEGMVYKVDAMAPKVDAVYEKISNGGLRMLFGPKEWSAIILALIGLVTNIVVTLGSG